MGALAGLSRLTSGQVGGVRVRLECGITTAETVLDRTTTEFE
ncbi:hypothetical protein [Allocoleopsis franciscana]|nr:hypothetical protein [Allocoleopsis franciscana]